MTTAQYLAEFNSLIDDAFAANLKLEELLQGELGQRRDLLESERRKLEIEIIALLAALMALTIVISRSVSKPLERAVTAANRIANGDLQDQQIRNAGSNETSRLLNALDDMRKSLLDSLTREREVATENARVLSALDSVSTSVMIADADCNIIYVNRAQADMLRVVESDIRKDLPQFTASKVIGVNIDSFHKNPAHQRGLLARLTGTHTAKLAIGGRRFKLIMSPVLDKDGKSVGTVVEWVDETETLTDIMSEISAASVEQSAGIEQVNTTITQMDDMTQQNAALVEEAAAAAQRMADQAGMLATAVSAFRLSQQAPRLAPPAGRGVSQSKAVAATPAPASKPSRALPRSSSKPESDEWEEF